MATTIGEYIKRDHDDFRLMFERLMDSTPKEGALREEVYPFLKKRIHAHHVAEEATIFPVMEKKTGSCRDHPCSYRRAPGYGHAGRRSGGDAIYRPVMAPADLPFYDVITPTGSRRRPTSLSTRRIISRGKTLSISARCSKRYSFVNGRSMECTIPCRR